MFFALPHTVGGEYNAVWDEKLSLCYALVQCKCGSVVGVKIHAVQGTVRLEALVGKVSQICSNSHFWSVWRELAIILLKSDREK